MDAFNEDVMEVLVKKEETGKLMADLYEFPYFNIESPPSLERMGNQIEQRYKISIQTIERLANIEHSFTKYKAILYPFRIVSDECIPVEGYEWVDRQRLKDLPFSSGHRKLLIL